MKGWKKWMAVGCSHGDQIDPEARKAALKFKNDLWKPDTTIHLGDFLDLAAFRSGAISDPNSSDRAASISDDLSSGIDFLHELRPQHILYGNHERSSGSRRYAHDPSDREDGEGTQSEIIPVSHSILLRARRMQIYPRLYV
jgi:hypothetical protein